MGTSYQEELCLRARCFCIVCFAHFCDPNTIQIVLVCFGVFGVLVHAFLHPPQRAELIVFGTIVLNIISSPILPRVRSRYTMYTKTSIEVDISMNFNGVREIP